MTLREFLKYYPDEKFEIGTHKGSGFLYIGEPGAEFNRFCRTYFNKRQDQLKKLVDAIQFMNKYSEEYPRLKSQVTKAINYMESYVDFRDREVVNATRSIIDNSYIVLTVTGKEQGKLSGLDLPELDYSQDINLDGCFKLLERVYADAAEEFQDAYRSYLTHPNDQRHKSALMAASTFFRNSPLVDFSGASGDEVLRTLKHKVMAEKKVVKGVRPDIAISSKLAENDYTKAQVAKACDISPSVLSKWCKGLYPKQLTDSMIRVCRYLKCEESVVIYYNNKLAQDKNEKKRQEEVAKQNKLKKKISPTKKKVMKR